MHKITVRTLFGLNLNSSSYKANGVAFDVLPEAQVIYISQAEADSVDAGTFTLGQRTIELHVRIKDFPNRYTLEETLKRRCKPGTSGPLVAGLDDGVDYQLDCRVTGIHRSDDDENVWIVVLSSGDTNWVAVDPDVFTTWSPSGSGGSHAIMVAGTDATRLNLTLTATAAPAGVWLYQQLVQIVNVPGLAIGLRTFFFVLNTAALVAAGKMQDDCNDLRLFDNGVQIPRWIFSPNTTTTLVAFTLNLAAGATLTLSSGTAQVETATAVGTIGTAGNAKMTVTAAGMTGSPKTITFAVAHSDTPTIWAGKARAALRLDADVTALFAVGSSGEKIALIRKAPAANDGTLNIALANDTCSGITGAPFSSHTRAGVLYSVASSGDIPTLNFDVTVANQATIKARPAQFNLMHGSEWFVVKKTASSPLDCKLTVLMRGALGTTEQGHQGGDVFYYLEHALILYYGNETAADPSTVANYSNNMGVFDLAQSDNSLAVYSATSLFYDPAHPNRPGSWAQIVGKKGPNSKLYTYKGAATSGDPALGIKAASYLNGATWTADNLTLGWMLTDPRCIRRITCTGRKYRSGTYWPVVKLQCSQDNGATWDDIFTETTPGSAGSFAALAAHTNIDIDPASTKIRLLISGLSDKIKDAYAEVEGLTFIIYWTTANVPSVTLLGERSNYHLDVRVTNSGVVDGVAVSDSIELLLPMQLDTPLTLDCENFLLTYDGQNYHSAMSLDDEGRDVPLQSWPGTNTITVSSVSGDDIGTLEFDPSVYRRRL